MNEEDFIEDFIRENKDKFTVYDLPRNHKRRFLLRLNLRIRHYISIVPYLAKVAIITIIIFIASAVIWNNYIRWDRDYVPLKYKIYGLIDKVL
ncbi:MAG TPA: hypothetical protein VHO46_12855 [Bacteroidales bacterium]|nr:hypothetical protein [Bacteroidales bacterium]